MSISAAVIGCGRMGAATRPEVAASVPPGWLPLAHADAVAATPPLRLDALCDVDAEALRRAAARHTGARAYDDVARMLREIRPVVVTVATRMPARRAILDAVVAAGARAVHCEKPFARSAGEADGLARLLRAGGVAFSYGATRRYHATYRQAAAMVAEGAIGALREIVVGFGAGRLLWTHAHSVDLFLFLSGCNAIEWVQAELAGEPGRAGESVDDDPIVRAASLRLANGASGVICELGGCDALIAGTEGTLRILADGAALEHMRAGKGGYFERVETRVAESGPSATQRALAELASRIDSADAPGPALEDARIGTHALMAMVESHRRGGARIRLGDVPPDLHVTGRVGTLTA